MRYSHAGIRSVFEPRNKRHKLNRGLRSAICQGSELHLVEMGARRRRSPAFGCRRTTRVAPQEAQWPQIEIYEASASASNRFLRYLALLQ